MTTRLVCLAAILAATPFDGVAAQRPSQRRCLLEVLNVDREGGRFQEFGDNINYYAGGNVRMRCLGQPVFLNGDSVESIGGQVVRLLGRAQYRDEDISIDADSLFYTKVDERLQAIGNARIVNRLNGSTLVGPRVDYLRAVPAVGRDSAEMHASGRPTVTYQVAAAPGDTVAPAPYVITADGLRGRGGSELTGWGSVWVDRDSLRGRGDSLLYLQAGGDVVTLVGAPATLRRVGLDSFHVAGRRVVLRLEGEALRQVQALGDGHVVGGAGEITADSTALDFAEGELIATRAWDRANGALVVAGGYDVRGDSVAIDTPAERLRELRVFGSGSVTEPLPDSVQAVPVDTTTGAEPPIRNQMTGSRVTARFIDVDSAGTLLTRVVDIVAIGSATSLFSRDIERNGERSPTINYTRADTIVVVMKAGDSSGVAEVRAFGNVDGAQLERESLRRRPALPSLERGTPRREEGP